MKQAKMSHLQKTSLKERKKLLVLLVNNNMVSQFTTSVILQRLNYLVFTVKTAEEALIAISIASPQIVLTDVTLPEMNGIALLQRLKREKGTKDIPVIIYTKQLDPATRQSCLQAGCSGYLVYPANPNQLYETIQQVTEATPRHFVRLNTSLEIIVGKEGIPGHRVRKERITALSVNGMYVNTENPLPYGTILPFTIFLQNTPEGSICIEGKVLYSHDGKGSWVTQPGMGVSFTSVRPEDRILIENFIQEKLMEGIAVTI